MSIDTQRPTLNAVLSRRRAVVIIAIVCALAVNLTIYAIGRAAGGSFIYTQAGAKITVDPLAITFMTVLPLAVGLTLVAWLSRRWPLLITAAKIIGPALALATVALMTVPAHFDGTSTLFLSSMHLALVPITLLSLSMLARRP